MSMEYLISRVVLNDFLAETNVFLSLKTSTENHYMTSVLRACLCVNGPSVTYVYTDSRSTPLKFLSGSLTCYMLLYCIFLFASGGISIYYYELAL